MNEKLVNATIDKHAKQYLYV